MTPDGFVVGVEAYAQRGKDGARHAAAACQCAIVPAVYAIRTYSS